MPNLPATDLRQNVLTLAVPTDRLPAVGYGMRALLPAEDYDPTFQGQYLQTTYFDTAAGALRKARAKKDKYLTLRIRCYAPTQGPGRSYPAGSYALSVKTESGKYRTELPSRLAEGFLVEGIFVLLEGGFDLPGDLIARLMDLAGEDLLVPTVTICMTRYAVESTTDRLTLDTGIVTSTGKQFPSAVLEVKTTTKPYEPIPEVTRWGFSPLKLSKFLWATTSGDR